MMRQFRLFALVGLSLFFSRKTAAQSPNALLATELDEVQVRSFAPERFLVGQKTLTLDSASISQGRYQTLADWLGTQVPLAIKSYGPGQLATVGLRGTGAVHTAVLWNGVNIVSPTLGQSDFSTLSVAGLDRLQVQYGAAASVLGSGAVGGSILLQTLPDWQHPGFQLTVDQRIAQFTNGQTQGVLRFTSSPKKGWQLSAKAAGYDGWLRNHTPYTERRGYLIEPSETGQRGLLADVFLKNKAGNQLSLNAWLSDNRLTIAPADPLGCETTRTRAARLLAGWEEGGTLLKAGFVRDITDYGKGAEYDTHPSHTETDRLLFRAEHERIFSGKSAENSVTVRVGGEVARYFARVDEYVAGHLAETRTDLFALLRYQISTRLRTSLNLRQAFVTGYAAPFTPSLGVDYQVVVSPKNRLSLKASVARSYRVPTLNERYWRTLGNPDLRPESGFSPEIGLAFQRRARATWSMEVTAYQNLVTNWTYWNPERGYRVENLQQVLARGLEATVRWERQAGRNRLGINGQYALTSSIQQRAYTAIAVDVVGKQLPFIPLHSGTASAWVQRGRSRLTGQVQATGFRYTTFDNSQFQRGYVLANLLFDSALRVGKAEGRVSFQANNLLDALVLSVKNNALLGRSFAVNLSFTFSSNP